MDLAPKYHVVVLACKRGGLVLTLDFHSSPATTRVEVHFLDLLNQCGIPRRVPGVEPTPDDWFDVVESGDSMDTVEDDCLEYQRPLRVPAPLNHSDPEVSQRRKEAVSPSAIGEVVQWQGAGGNMVREPLPLCILSGTNPTVEVGSIIEMDGIAKDPKEPPIRGGEPLQLRVCFMELLLREGVGHEVPVRSLHIVASRGCIPFHRCTGCGSGCVCTCILTSYGPSIRPARVSHRTAGGIQVGVGNSQGCCRGDGGRDKRPATAINAGTTGATICADSCAGSGH
jgi:hypothetical protein